MLWPTGECRAGRGVRVAARRSEVRIFLVFVGQLPFPLCIPNPNCNQPSLPRSGTRALSTASAMGHRASHPLTLRLRLGACALLRCLGPLALGSLVLEFCVLAFAPCEMREISGIGRKLASRFAYRACIGARRDGGRRARARPRGEGGRKTSPGTVTQGWT